MPSALRAASSDTAGMPERLCGVGKQSRRVVAARIRALDRCRPAGTQTHAQRPARRPGIAEALAHPFFAALPMTAPRGTAKPPLLKLPSTLTSAVEVSSNVECAPKTDIPRAEPPTICTLSSTGAKGRLNPQTVLLDGAGCI